MWEDVTLPFCLDHRCPEALCSSFSSYLPTKAEVDKSRITRAWLFKILKANVHKLESCPSNDSEASAAAVFKRKKTDVREDAKFLFLVSFPLNKKRGNMSLETKYFCYWDLFEEKNRKSGANNINIS